jgi:hypothetical protein
VAARVATPWEDERGLSISDNRRGESTRLAHVSAGRRCKEYPVACTARLQLQHESHHAGYSRANPEPEHLHRPGLVGYHGGSGTARRRLGV